MNRVTVQSEIIKLQAKCIKLLMGRLEQRDDSSYDYSTFCDWRQQIRDLTKVLKENES